MTESEEESNLGELLRKRDLYQHKPPIYGRRGLERNQPQDVTPTYEPRFSVFPPKSRVQM